MKGYSKASAHHGKTAYRTPSRWLAGKPEAFKRMPKTKIKNLESRIWNLANKPRKFSA